MGYAGLNSTWHPLATTSVISDSHTKQQTVPVLLHCRPRPYLCLEKIVNSELLCYNRSMVKQLFLDRTYSDAC